MKYYSEKLDKVFDTEAELTTAEEADAKAKAEKEEAKKLVKADATKVEDAFKARNEARRQYNAALIDLRKAYHSALRTAEKELSDGIERIAKDRDAAEAVYSDALAEFQSKHPEGYRISLKDGDNVVTLSSNPIDSHVVDLSTEFDNMLDLFSNLLKRW
jgi:chromatin segregation and condensation protein Rec8/ScpA/Scc1 (kleisin family)